MNDKKRKQKQHYVNQAKRAKYEKKKLHPGLRGFLCTTNNRERECVREAYNILNEFANDLYGSEMDVKKPSEGTEEVEESLEAELAALKQEKTTKGRRFQQVDSGARNCIFISTQLEETSPLVERIAEEIQRTGTQRTRYLMRMLPIQVTCKATEDDIRASAEQMIKKSFTELGVSYTTVYRSRNQGQLTQTDAQTAINQLIDAVCPTARLDHKTPQLTIVMEVIRNVVCLGVVRDYHQRRKYNLVELARAAGGEGGPADAAQPADTQGGARPAPTVEATDGARPAPTVEATDGSAEPGGGEHGSGAGSAGHSANVASDDVDSSKACEARGDDVGADEGGGATAEATTAGGVEAAAAAGGVVAAAGGVEAAAGGVDEAAVDGSSQLGAGEAAADVSDCGDVTAEGGGAVPPPPAESDSVVPADAAE